MLPEVDVVILSRDASPLDSRVERGLAAQPGVRLRTHRLTQPTHPAHPNRWATIAAKRNLGRRLGSSPWVMFVDDDVELEPGTIARLLAGLRAAPHYAALAADYHDSSHVHRPTHVAMGATLFRRSALALIRFRWEPGRCECQCCCDDLRRHALGIAYAPGIRATHRQFSDARRGAHAVPTCERPLPRVPRAGQGEGLAAVVGRLAFQCPTRFAAVNEKSAVEELMDHGKVEYENGNAADGKPIRGCILAAFNRRHVGKFRRQFLGTLRRAGNDDLVRAVGYGLYPSEQSAVSRLQEVLLRVFPESWLMPPIRRLFDFQGLLAELPPESPVAYWDAADVFFQGSLAPLWRLVEAHPDRLLAVREPVGYPRNKAVTKWSQSIRDPFWRRRAFELLKTHPFLNSGFAAGTARTMLAYFREAHRLRHSVELLGTTDWGDQMALNLYCHLDANRWLEIDEGWNFCTHDRPRGEVHVQPDGRVVRRRGTNIQVTHANAHSLRKLELYGY